MTPQGTDQAQLRDALHRLTPEERNFLVLYQRGGPSNVVRELGGKHEDVEARLAAIRARVGAVHAQELATAAARENEEPTRTAIHGARPIAPGPQPSVNGALQTVRADEPTDNAENDEPTAPDVEDAVPPAPVGLDRRADSPIIDAMRSLGRPTTVPELAKVLDRIPGNVATRMRQLEREGPPRVRRTGQKIQAGRGGPRVEWELTPAADLTDAEVYEAAVGSSRDTPAAPPEAGSHDMQQMRRDYFDVLLNRLRECDPDDLDLIADRIELFLAGGGPQREGGDA